MEISVKHYDRAKFILLFLWAASLPFFYQISNVLIGAGAFLTIAKAISIRKITDWRFDSLSICFLCYFLMEIAGLLYTSHDNIRYGISVLDKHQALILVPLIFVDYQLKQDEREKVLLGFVAACFLAMVFCLVVNTYSSFITYDMWFHPWQFSHHRLSEPIDMGAVYFALYLSLAFLIVLDHLRKKSGTITPSGKLVLISLLIVFCLTIIASGARTAIVMLMICVVAQLVQYAVSKKSYRMLILAALTPFIFIGIILMHPIVNTRFKDMMRDSYESSNYGSYFARWKIWEPGIEAIRENFWLGTGTGDHEEELNKKFIKYNYYEGVDLFNMHNQYLQSLLMHGIFGLLLFLAILIIQIRKGLINRDWLYLFYLTLFIGACLTESLLSRNKGVIFFLFFSFVFFKSQKTR